MILCKRIFNRLDVSSDLSDFDRLKTHDVSSSLVTIKSGIFRINA